MREPSIGSVLARWAATPVRSTARNHRRSTAHGTHRRAGAIGYPPPDGLVLPACAEPWSHAPDRHDRAGRAHCDRLHRVEGRRLGICRPPASGARGRPVAVAIGGCPAAADRHGEEAHQAHRVPHQGEPDVRHDVRTVPGRRRRHHGPDLRRSDDAARAREGPHARRRAQLHRRVDRRSTPARWTASPKPATSSTTARTSPTTGGTRSGSPWRIASSARCTDRPGSSTSGRSRRNRTDSSITSVPVSSGRPAGSSATIRTRRPIPSRG